MHTRIYVIPMFFSNRNIQRKPPGFAFQNNIHAHIDRHAPTHGVELLQSDLILVKPLSLPLGKWSVLMISASPVTDYMEVLVPRLQTRISWSWEKPTWGSKWGEKLRDRGPQAETVQRSEVSLQGQGSEGTVSQQRKSQRRDPPLVHYATTEDQHGLTQ